MASIKKLKSGKWQAQIARRGVRKSSSFPTKQQAKDWAARQEHLISQGQGSVKKAILRDLFDRYSHEVSSKKRGARWEYIRLKKLGRDKIAEIELPTLQPSDFADWRDRRLKEVSASSVRREMQLMSAALNVARKEWGWLTDSPLADVRKPSGAPPRDRRVSDDEIERLRFVSGLEADPTPDTRIKRSVLAFLFALETGMRAGEIIGLNWQSVNLDSRVAHLPKTKNGTSRDVPLSKAALTILQVLREFCDGESGTCFQLSSAQLDALFRKIRDKAAIENLHFHDSRHEAVTRLAGKLDVLSLARMIGHRDIRMLQIYYNANAADMVDFLD